MTHEIGEPSKKNLHRPSKRNKLSKHVLGVHEKIEVKQAAMKWQVEQMIKLPQTTDKKNSHSIGYSLLVNIMRNII